MSKPSTDDRRPRQFGGDRPQRGRPATSLGAVDGHVAGGPRVLTLSRLPRLTGLGDRRTVAGSHNSARIGGLMAASSDVVRQMYDSFADRDAGRLLALLDEHCEWRMAETVPWGGVHRGPDGVMDV